MSGLTITSTIKGVDALQQRFADLGDSLRAHLRIGLANAGRLIQAAEASLAPRKSGDLADTIRVKFLETDSAMTVSVRPSKFYALFMEEGVVNHGTRSNKAALVDRKTKGGKFKLQQHVRELRVQGQFRIQPKHFIQRAWEASQASVDQEIAKAVSEAVAEVE